MKVNVKKYFICFSIVFFALTIKALPVSNEVLDNESNSVISQSINSTKELTTEQKTNSNKNQIQKLQEYYQNDDIVGNIKIENTDLNSIIAKTDDNSYYLNHNLRKEKDNLGVSFMDYRNNIDDQKILIYGHNSQKVDTEFHLLENFLNKSYYQKHQNIIFETEKNTYTYKIFSIIVVTTDYQHMKLNFTDTEWKQHLNFLKTNALYNTETEISEQDDIIILQTCYYEPKDSYLLVAGKKIKTENS